MFCRVTLPIGQAILPAHSEIEMWELAVHIASPNIKSTSTRDGRILLDLRAGQMFSVNVVGSKILELIEQGYDEGRIAEEISRDFAASVEVVRHDVRVFFQALHEHGIVNPTNPSASEVCGNWPAGS